MAEVLHGERGRGLDWVTVEDGWGKRTCTAAGSECNRGEGMEAVAVHEWRRADS